MDAVEPQEVYKANIEALIRTWASEKGIDIYVDQLLKLLDEDFLRTFPAIRNIPLPRKSERGADGRIPNRHWRYRFYHGVAAVLGWQERITYGDPRYWSDELHKAVKNLCPDDQPLKPEKRRLHPLSTDVPSSSVDRKLDHSADSAVATCKVTCNNSCCRVVCSVQAVTDSSDRKRRKLPSWVMAVSIDKSDIFSQQKSPTESENSAEGSSDEEQT
ncbi:hypothetical protein R1sor_025751 [Riccia sorocarpa]|uniref:Uncharacterized protein n=1 Tax=Riccia sorocarpa TaxID=122646 RepID=A0ABD3GA05_9MARC